MLSKLSSGGILIRKLPSHRMGSLCFHGKEIMANWPLVLFLLGLKDFEIKSVKCYFSQSVSK